MKTVNTIKALRESLKIERQKGLRIGFVPTMGNLHEGHLELVRLARKQADFVVASIFVNPLQFGANEDLDAYPRTLKADQEKLESVGCDLLFAPSVEEVYPNGTKGQTIVDVPGLTNLHCGASRPGHFQGVATVVTKLFGMVQPDCAVFGLKDFQQITVIRQMTEDLSLPVEIIPAPIARAESGLALSSRNGYLTETELGIAPELNKALREAQSALLSGERDYAALQERFQQQLEAAGFKRDYFNVCRRSDLQPAERNDKQLVILAAAYLGKARLIDNQVVDLSN